MDRAKRAVEWPPPAAAERSAKKPCCHRDPSGSGSVPEISSLLSSLSVAKRHSPASPPAAPLNKRPRYDHHDAAALDARMRGLEISCETTDMEEEEREQGPDWAGFLPELLGLICGRLPLADVPRFGAVCRHWRSCAFPVYPADAAPVLLGATLAAGGFGPELAYKNCHLVDSQSELLAVLTGSNGAPPIHVLRLDETKVAWKRVTFLGGRSLFTGTTSSVAVAEPVVESMADKVYLPKFYGRPQVIQAELAESDGRLFFVSKAAEQEWQGLVAVSGGGDYGGPWCYDMESDSGGQLVGSKTLLQSFWVHLSPAASPSPDDHDDDDDGMVLD